ncbi:MAG: hypothetical protein K2J20_06070, partial [Bacilli bacterium]|nr:hypothetical protein [Bacilli bacterium]
MKRFLSLVLLVVVVSGIISMTTYTLNNKGIREEPNKTVKNKIEKITSNISNDTLTEVFNVYVGGLKYKLKLDYNVVNEDDIYSLYLVAYFDGKSILSGYVANSLELTNIEEFKEDEYISKYVIIDIPNIKTFNDLD